MPDLKTVLTETQLGDMQFRVELALQAAESDCLEGGQIPGYPMWADAAINAMFEYLAGLPGVAVVQIPEPDEREDEDQEFSDFPGRRNEHIARGEAGSPPLLIHRGRV